MNKNADLLNRITKNPKIMVGKPTIRGTRLTVETIIDLLATGFSHKEIMEFYPNLLTEEDIKACLLYVSKLLEKDKTSKKVA